MEAKETNAEQKEAKEIVDDVVNSLFPKNSDAPKAKVETTPVALQKTDEVKNKTPKEKTKKQKRKKKKGRGRTGQGQGRGLKRGKSRASTNIVRFEPDAFKKSREEGRLNVEAAEFKPRDAAEVSADALREKYLEMQSKLREQRAEIESITEENEKLKFDNFLTVKSNEELQGQLDVLIERVMQLEDEVQMMAMEEKIVSQTFKREMMKRMNATKPHMMTPKQKMRHALKMSLKEGQKFITPTMVESPTMTFEDPRFYR